MPIITCPHCGARRNTPREKLPHKAVNARCPECCNSFTFDPATISPKKAEQKVAPINVTCPHCGFPREIPGNRQANQQATVNCRRCQRPFRLAQGSTVPAKVVSAAHSPQLRGIGRLLADSWELFCKRGWGLLSIYLLASLLIFVPLLAASVILPGLVMGNRSLAWACLIAGSTYGILGSAWITASMFSHICNPTLSVLAALGQGRRQFWKFTGLLLLLGLIVAGGSLAFIVPGFVFLIWFFFCQYILADEGIGGLQALQRSRQLVRGHGWQVCGRFLLLLLVALAVSVLSNRLPVIGAPLNFAFSLLLTPFSLLYYYLLYQDLKRCQPKAKPTPQGLGLPLTTAIVGWMLIPALLFIVNTRSSLTTAELSKESSAVLSSLFSPEQKAILEQAEQKPAYPILPTPEPLTLLDYDRLLSSQQLPAPPQGINLGPAILTKEQFWHDEQEPHLWLKLQLAELPNLALSPRRSIRILIDKVLDAEQNNYYDRGHSFENEAFEWINILPSGSLVDGYGGIRNIYLKQGTRQEQVQTISGKVELNLPLGIESLQLNRADIGKTLQVAGKALKVEQLNDDGIAVSFRGKLSELLSIRAVNQADEPLAETGRTWQQAGGTISFKQMFSGQVDSVTVLVATDSATRSYPFEMTR